MSFNNSYNNSGDIYKKTERLCCAIFLVSNVILGPAELKSKMHSLTLDLVGAGAKVKDIYSRDRSYNLSKMSELLLELASLVHIGAVAGFISEMNASILKPEFDDLYKILEANRSAELQRTKFGESFLNL